METAQAMGAIENLLDLDFGTPSAPQSATNGVDLLSLDFGAIQVQKEDDESEMETFIDQDQAQGLEIIGKFKQFYND